MVGGLSEAQAGNATAESETKNSDSLDGTDSYAAPSVQGPVALGSVHFFFKAVVKLECKIHQFIGSSTHH